MGPGSRLVCTEACLLCEAYTAHLLGPTIALAVQDGIVYPQQRRYTLRTSDLSHGRWLPCLGGGVLLVASTR